MKIIKTLILALLVGGTGLSQANAQEVEPSPVSIFTESTPPEKVQEYRRNYRSVDFLVNGDQGNYSFLNMPEFYQTATVYRGAGQVAMLKKKLDKSLLDTKTDTDLGKMSVGELLTNEKAQIQGVLVIHNGKIVMEEYPGMRELDKHSWFSASKQLTGVAIHILSEEGLIDLEQSVNHYIPEYDSEDWKKVKVKHLLHHVSGMDYVETNANFMNPDHALSQITTYSLASRHEDGGISAFDLIKGVKSYIEPGVKYDYASPNTQVLGFIIERVTGQKYEEVISEKIWTKIGMESDGHFALSAQGEPLAAGYFGSRLRDFGRFAMLFTPSWRKVADEQIVSDSYFEKVYDTTYAEALKRGVETEKAKFFKDGQSHATYQWDLVFDDGDLFKAGRYGQGIYVSPETNTVVVFFSSVYMNKIYFPDFARQIVKQNYR
ncbi:serine hydrolase domain-containing protein [Carboxylicivirga linearis]|uniref:Beta-lactamase family protein n=1 Tax=Carboxylicivirga linearis TaxID=1628157 RepID=A0ABS5K1C8_9BACT|nr:serine hydrolase domain-containing protein [Carboxylicivirga linearis]MBS2100494.1 beta-lactamase family protein [Carboxylicivirga linearis]